MVVAFSSLVMIFGECLTIHSPLFFLFFFLMEISFSTLIPLFMQGSVHSGSVNCDDCGRVFPDELHVSVIS